MEKTIISLCNNCINGEKNCASWPNATKFGSGSDDDAVISCNNHTTIVMVQYKKGDNPDGPVFGGRDYAYYSTLEVAVGDIVEVPGVHGLIKAKVTAVNAAKEEVEAFKDKVKFIASKYTMPQEGITVED